MWSVWYVVSRGSGGGIGYRETTRAPVLPAVTQRAFEMNYFIANCALSSLCGLHYSLQFDNTSQTFQSKLRALTDWDWEIKTQHPPDVSPACWDGLSPSWIPFIAFSVCRSRSINGLHSNQTRRWITGSADASRSQWGWYEVHPLLTVS